MKIYKDNYNNPMQKLVNKLESLLPIKKIDIFGRNQLMDSIFPYFTLAFLTIIGLVFKLHSGFLLIFLMYALLPLLDQFFNLDARNPTEKQRRQLQEKDWAFMLPLYITAILDWIFFFQSMRIFSQFEYSFTNFIYLCAYVVTYWTLNSAQFAVCHEIFHKPGIFYKYFGTAIQLKNLYAHFPYEHMYGHHRRVATSEDPASAEKGINLYSFFVRSFLGSYKSVYRMERQNKKPFFANYGVLSVVVSVLFAALIFKIYGTQAGILFLIGSHGAIFFLEIINYIEHYGLRRQKKADGSYEKVTIKHSWNAPHRFTNYFLFKVQRHSDHHENSTKPYQTLLSLEESPHLPHGYTLCIIMAAFPWVWRRIMDPLVDEYNKTKTGGINGAVMQKAVKQSRKFIVQVSLFITGILLISLLLY